MCVDKSVVFCVRETFKARGSVSSPKVYLIILLLPYSGWTVLLTFVFAELSFYAHNVTLLRHILLTHRISKPTKASFLRQSLSLHSEAENNGSEFNFPAVIDKCERWYTGDSKKNCIHVVKLLIKRRYKSFSQYQ